MEKIKQLIDLNVEIEGLLRVAGMRPSREAVELAKAKFAEFASLFAGIDEYLAGNEETPAIEDETAAAATDAPEVVTAEMAEPEGEPESPTAVEAEPQAEHEAEPQAKPKAEHEAEPQAEPKAEHDVKPSQQDAPSGASKMRPPVNLMKVFTLNDKFRFRRDLFHGNEADFIDTLNILSEMNSYAEASDYLLSDMAWNPEDENVAYFLSILKENMPA